MIKKSSFLVLSFVVLIALSGCPDKEDSQKEETEQIPNTMEKASSELEQVITLLGGPIFGSRDKIEQLKNNQMQMLTSKTEEKPEQSTTGTSKTGQNEETGGSENKQGQQGSNKEQNQGNQQEKSSGSDKGGSKDQNKSGGNQSGQQENAGEQQGAQKPSAAPSPTKKAEKPFQFEDSLFGVPQWNEENWKMIKVLTDGMYFTWNNLQPQLLDKGISQAQSQSFGVSLDSLSAAVRDKNLNNAETSAFELYRSLADFFSFYKTQKPPELQRISAMITGIHFSVRQNKWDKAQELSNQLQQEFTKVKTSVKDNQTEAIKMLEISLDDLRGAVQKQDPSLVMIRTNLVAANIEELDTKLSQQQK